MLHINWTKLSSDIMFNLQIRTRKIQEDKRKAQDFEAKSSSAKSKYCIFAVSLMAIVTILFVNDNVPVVKIQVPFLERWTNALQNLNFPEMIIHGKWKNSIM